MKTIENPKVCILGMGDHGKRGHLDHLIGLATDPVIGVYDSKMISMDSYRVVLDAADRRKGREPVTFGTLAAALEKSGVELRFFGSEAAALEWADAAMICTPDRFHLAQMQAALAADCHVFCEKPLVALPKEAITPEQVQAAVKAGMAALKEVFALAAAKGLTVTSCHPRRFDPPYIGLKNLLPELVNAYGPALEVKLDFSYHIPSKDEVHHGMLEDHANHEMDYLCWLFGDASFHAVKWENSQDRYHLSGKRADGLVFHFGGTRRLHVGAYPETIWIRFARGEVFVDTYKEENSYRLDHSLRLKSPLKVGITDYALRFGNLNRHWLNMLAGWDKNYLTKRQMLLNTEISVAMPEGIDSFSYDATRA